MRVPVSFALAVIVTLAGTQAVWGDAKWRVAQRIDVDKVPSWFPVGFSLLTHGRRQYVAYYDAKHRMTVASRRLDEKQWRRVRLDSKVGWDSHNGVTMAVDAAGCIHLSGNMHCRPLIYFRTDRPGDITSFKRLAMTGVEEHRCTYPRFLEDLGGRLIFNYRSGGSGNGKRIYNVYDPKTRKWARLLDEPLFDGQGKRNAYPSGPTLGPDRRFHVVWVWRDTPDCATNHHLSYARSKDLIHWETAAGKAVRTPLTLDQEVLCVDPVPSGGGIINGCQKLAFDSKQRPMISYHKSDGKGHMQIHVARFEDGAWKRRTVTNWDKRVKFSGRGAMPFIGIRISGLRRLEPGVLYISYRHRDYGTGKMAIDEKTLKPLDRAVKVAGEYPKELAQREIDFEGISVRRASDAGDAGGRNVEYVLKWETLAPNYDRRRKGPLPPASTLRLFKLVADDKPK